VEIPEGLLQGIERKIAAQRTRRTPAHAAAEMDCHDREVATLRAENRALDDTDVRRRLR